MRLKTGIKCVKKIQKLLIKMLTRCNRDNSAYVWVKVGLKFFFPLENIFEGYNKKNSGWSYHS
ncbi:hypothetical protein HZS_2300 [Henneguya salminicola]|nr:hypothetical protein HZS_2300 [Henneguya salminicola]